ncbi:hypothetical protein ACFLVR_01855 [Chloroflexota bacterium]
MHRSVIKIIAIVAILTLLITPSFGGTAGAFSPDTNLSTADASFVGEDTSDYSGYSVASAGDVNGDGYDDFLIGAYSTNAGGNNDSGRTYLVLGKALGWANGIELEDAIASFDGEAVNDQSGRAISPAGDANNDGYDDFLIGAANSASAGAGAGKVYLILGRPAANWGFGFSLTNADASFNGEAAGDNAGFSLAAGGDINNDGYDDFLIGANNNDEGDTNAGKIYVIQGKAAADWGQGFNLANANASFVGENANDNAGSSVSSAGDVNNDGYSDFLIGAYMWDNGADTNVGQTYLILGEAGAIDWGPSLDLSNANHSFIGEAVNDNAAYSLSSAGDVNNDNYDDFLIGAYHNDNGAVDAGQTYLILGKATPDWGLLKSLAEADASFLGEIASDQSGISVASAGNVNGDAYDDFIIGANNYNAGANNDAGKTYLIFGKASGWAMDFDLAGANASFIGETQGDTSGQSIALAGDVNNDGANDILIGAPNFQYAGDAGAGKTYLLLGNTAPNAPTSPRCEGETNPALVNDATPEFSWNYSDNNAIDTQTAYQILVASSSANLTANNGDLWDSGKVASASSASISYAGSALPWGAASYWKVKVWDNHDAEGLYCGEQTFTMQTAPNAPTAPLCEGETNPTGVLDITPQFGWTFSDPDDPDSQSAYQILVASTSENLTADTGDLWDSGKVASTSSTSISYAGTSPGTSWGTTYYWKVKAWDSSDAAGDYCAEQTFTTQVIPNAPIEPKCEGLTNPAALTDISPEFTWKFSDTDNVDNQSAYRILVASTSANLTAGTGDVWDSGKVESVASGASYGGTALSDGTTYYWQVKTWDNLGAEGPYCAEQTLTIKNILLPFWAEITISAVGAAIIGAGIVWLLTRGKSSPAG